MIVPFHFAHIYYIFLLLTQLCLCDLDFLWVNLSSLWQLIQKCVTSSSIASCVICVFLIGIFKLYCNQSYLCITSFGHQT